jgi:methionyl aminopeptidase
MVDSLTSDDFRTMRKAGKVAASVMKKMASFIRVGVATKDIEEFFEKFLEKYPGMKAAFKGFMGYTASCCVSVNEEIIHGIPGKRVIRDGDLVSVDLGIKYKGLFVDTAHTYIIGRASKEARKLVKTTERALYEGIKKIKVGATIGDIGSAVQDCAENNGFSVIRKFVGHGIGHDLHLPPEVPNFGEKGEGVSLCVGQAIAVEPMVSSGSYDVEVLNDGWTAKTLDGSLSAHFEHTIAVTKKGPWVLTQ